MGGRGVPASPHRSQWQSAGAPPRRLAGSLNTAGSEGRSHRTATMANKGDDPEHLPPFPGFATDAIHFGQDPEQWNSLAVVPPITLSTTFKQRDPEIRGPFYYSRSGNPNRKVLEELVAALSGAEHSLAYSSGMGAILNICRLLKAGDTVVCTIHIYAGTKKLFDEMREYYKLEVHYVDFTKLCNLEAAIPKKTKLVWIESLSNPTLQVIDIKACAEIVHRKAAEALLVVDNTFMSPYLQRPLSLGADICMSSASKYINGHSDIILGLVSVKSKDLYEKLKDMQSGLGAVPSPFDCYMCTRGLKTLPIRMKLHFCNALAVAEYLETHPRVEKVLFPELPSHPQHAVFMKQSTGCPGVVSFYIKGNKENAFAFLRKLKVFTLGYNVGDVESLAEHPATMTHASLCEEFKIQTGITDDLIRLSVGLEDKEDLLADLDQALNAAFA